MALTKVNGNADHITIYSGSETEWWLNPRLLRLPVDGPEGTDGKTTSTIVMWIFVGVG
jgi:hypothetical protein